MYYQEKYFVSKHCFETDFAYLYNFVRIGIYSIWIPIRVHRYQIQQRISLIF